MLAVVAVGAYLAFFADRSVDLLDAEVGESVEAYAQQVVVGNCIESLPSDGAVGSVTVVPCDEAHQSQVIGARKYSTSTDFPGTDEVTSATAEKCTTGAIDAPDVDLSAITLSVWAPTEDSWSEGDRQGLCIASVPDTLDTSLLD